MLNIIKYSFMNTKYEIDKYSHDIPTFILSEM